MVSAQNRKGRFEVAKCGLRRYADVKPNNVLISYTLLPDHTLEISDIALSDMEAAARLEEGEGIFTQVGNTLWRSPEAHAGTCVGKASDIWSFGVTVSASHLLAFLAGYRILAND